MSNLYALVIYYKDNGKAATKRASFDLSSFSFFVRRNVKEFMEFAASVLVERTDIGQRVSVKEREYRCHVYVRSDYLAGVVVSNLDYLPRVAFALATRALEQFTNDFPPGTWPGASPDLSYPPLDALLAKYQNPKEADSLLKIQSDLDETKIVLHDTIQAALEKGELLDELVNKTDRLKDSSKTFYNGAKSANSCCSVM